MFSKVTPASLVTNEFEVSAARVTHRRTGQSLPITAETFTEWSRFEADYDCAETASQLIDGYASTMFAAAGLLAYDADEQAFMTRGERDELANEAIEERREQRSIASWHNWARI